MPFFMQSMNRVWRLQKRKQKQKITPSGEMLLHVAPQQTPAYVIVHRYLLVTDTASGAGGGLRLQRQEGRGDLCT